MIASVSAQNSGTAVHSRRICAGAPRLEAVRSLFELESDRKILEGRDPDRVDPSRVASELDPLDPWYEFGEQRIHLDLRKGLTDAGMRSRSKPDMRVRVSIHAELVWGCLLYTSPSPRDLSTSRMPSSA